MSRNSRIWQDSLAHSTVYDGDVTGCVKWLGWAKQKLQFMLHNTAGPHTATFNPGPDVTIRVDTRPNRIAIKIAGGIYLESGFIDVLNSGACAEATYLPAVLNFNSVVSAYMASVEYPLQGKLQFTKYDPPLLFGGEHLVGGQDSLSVGCAGKLPSITLEEPCSVTYSNGGYCEPGKILMKKKCLSLVPSSLFSGKMRLFIQSMYGSKRKDYSCDWSSIGFDHTLTLEEHSLSGFVSGNSGLLTTEDYQYFLVQVGPSSLVYYSLKIDSAAEPLRQFLISTAGIPLSTKKKIEAYILSTATLDKRSLGTGVTVPFTTTVGITLANGGWAWAWDGHQADIIKHEPNGSTKQYTARHYRLTMTSTLVDGAWVLSADVVTVSTSNWWPIDGKINIIYPNYATADTQMLPLLGSIPYRHIHGDVAVGGNGTSSYSAKIFCYRDNDDMLQIASASYSVTFFSGTYNGAEPVPTVAGIAYVSQDTKAGPGYSGSFTISVGDVITHTVPIEFYGNYVHIEKQLSGSAVYHGWTWPGANNNVWPYPGANPFVQAREANGVVYTGGQTLTQWMVSNGYWVNGSQSVIAGYMDRGDGVQTEIQYGADVYIQWYRNYYEASNPTDENPGLFLEIPWGSFNSLFVGKYGFNKSSGLQIGSSDPLPITSKPWSPHSWSVVQFYYNQFGVPTKIGTIGHTQMCAMSFYPLTYQITETYTGALNKKETSYSYLDAAGNLLNFYTFSETTTNEDRNWHFSLQVLSPLLGTIEQSKVAFSGSKYTFTGGGPLTYDIEYPGTSSVGWA